MSEPPFLLTHQGSAPDPLLMLRSCANTYAKAGQISEALRTLRKSLPYEVVSKEDSHESAFSKVLANIYVSNQRAVAQIEEEIRELTSRALRAHPKHHEELIRSHTEEMIIDLAELLERVYNLGMVQQLMAGMPYYGIHDEDLAWMEERFQDNPSDETDGP